MKNLNRRQFLKWGVHTGINVSLGASLGTLGLSALMRSAQASKGLPLNPSKKNEVDPHFFLMITLADPSGLDGSYLFDARPLEMTKAGIIQNYRKTGEPTLWTGTNGISTWATDLVKPLLPFKNDFSILNGVLMDVGFDGHDQNVNYLFTGDPFGGECFIPVLNEQNPRELDAIINGNFNIIQNNGSKSVPLSPDGAQSLVSALKKIPPLRPNSSLFQFVRSRFEANAGGSGALAESSAIIKDAFAHSGHLAETFELLQSQAQPHPSPSENTPGGNSTSGQPTTEDFIRFAAEAFRAGATRSAICVLEQFQLDTHSPSDAKKQPESYATLGQALANLFSLLKSTPYDDHRSIFDVTTFLFGAEFGRTLRQEGAAIDQTGTDHNPLTNSMIIGGKGIKGGQVIGASDFGSVAETLSPTHLSLDPRKLKAMGRPFDFSQCIPRTDLPKEFKPGDYLGVNSVINTLYRRMGVDQKHWRALERNGAAAPVIASLLS